MRKYLQDFLSSQQVKLIFITSLIVFSTTAKEIKVLNFNILCNLCLKKDQLSYSDRSPAIKEYLHEKSFDLISVQELTLHSQIKFLFPEEKYQYHVYQNDWLAYPDTTLLYNSERFELIDKGHFWLGPENEFNFGWDFAIPRVFLWIKLKDKVTQKEFLFSGAHIDNLPKNLTGSAKKISSFLVSLKIPYLFAGDTNIPRGSEDFNFFKEIAIDLTKPMDQELPISKQQDYCYRHRSRDFPNCMVEHAMASQHFQLKRFEIDVTRIKGYYLSDHRPQIMYFEWAD